MDLKDYSKVLENKVQQLATRDLHEANLDAIYMLAVACEARDQDTGEHVRRIEHYTRMLSHEMNLPEKEAERIAYSSVLHDVGKLHVPDRILHKPGPLDDEEHGLNSTRSSASAFFPADRSLKSRGRLPDRITRISMDQVIPTD